jgi:hypothetical protein
MDCRIVVGDGKNVRQWRRGSVPYSSSLKVWAVYSFKTLSFNGVDDISL